MTNYKMYTEEWYRSQAAKCAYEGDWEGEAWYGVQANHMAKRIAAAEEAGMTIGDYLFKEGWSIDEIDRLLGGIKVEEKVEEKEAVVYTAVWSGVYPLITYGSVSSFAAAVAAANGNNGRSYEEPYDFYHAGVCIPLERAIELAAQGQLVIVD